ncbi:MAG: TonB-dependent receptor, partial [bacterium]
MKAKFSLAVLVLLLVVVSSVQAGTTGKITGRVVDQETNEPLAGVNVVIKGTTMGAATGINGQYFILNVPPGSYTLSAQMIGYIKQEVQSVIVNVDLTTMINFSLSSTVLDVGEGVTVVAERPLIQRDATASAAIVSSAEIEVSPVETFKEVVQNKAGVTVDRDGDIHIRGGRADEIVYLVDGVANVDPFDSKLGIEVSTNAIEELSVISGSFNAEYGQALSGVINIVTKQGPKDYSGNILFQTGDLLSDYDIELLPDIQEKAKETDLLNTKEVEASFGGPIPGLGNSLSFYISGRYFDDKGFLYGKRIHSTTDYADSIQTGDGKIISTNPFNQYNIQNKLTFAINPAMRLQYTNIVHNKEWQEYSHSRKYIVDGHLNYFERGNRHGLKLIHQISSRAFYTMDVAYQWKKYWYYAYENPQDPRYVWTGYYKEDSNYEFYTGGAENRRRVQNSITVLGKFDMTSQIGSAHEFKLGLEARRLDLYEHDYYLNIDQRAEPFTDENSNGVYDEGEPFVDINLNGEWTTAKDDNNDGIPGNIIEAAGRLNNKYRRKPIEMSAYLQDKIELEDMVINAGLRFDYLDPASDYLFDWVKQGEPITKPAKKRYQISPRFSLAHPITDRGKLFFSYGHFFQLPPYYRLYQNSDFDVRVGGGRLISETDDLGNANLKPQKTISYEIGFEQEIMENVAMYLKVFYRDIRNLLGQQIYRFPSGDSYAFFINRDFGNVKGVTFTIDKRFSNFFSASVDYTYMRAEGNESDPTRTRRDYRLSIEPQKQVVFLDWDQPHALRGNLHFGQRKNWGASAIIRLESGYPYTPQAANEIIRIAEENSGRKIP